MFNLTSTLGPSRWLDAASWRQQQATQRLASLRRINSAADDAAGLSISERFLAQMNGDRIAHQGAVDGLSLSETADGALGQVSSNLQRMRELALQSRNGTLNDRDRASLDHEYQQLGEEVNRVVGNTTFNGQKILADDAGTRKINTGAGSHDTLDLRTPDLRQDTNLSGATSGSIATPGGSQTMLDTIDRALDSVGRHRATLGASENRLQAVADATDLHYESASRAYDRLVSADIPATSGAWHQASVQQYAAISMLRSNQSSMQRLLSLFG